MKISVVHTLIPDFQGDYRNSKNYTLVLTIRLLKQVSDSVKCFDIRE